MVFHTGQGGLWLDILVTALLWICGLLQVAQVRDQSLPESRQADASRWLIAACLVGLAVRFTYKLIIDGDILVPPYSLIPLALGCLGGIGLSLDRLKRTNHNRRVTDRVEWSSRKTFMAKHE